MLTQSDERETERDIDSADFVPDQASTWCFNSKYYINSGLFTDPIYQIKEVLFCA